jgi:DNA-binding winged helix-turn-helix (wHTH) protein
MAEVRLPVDSGIRLCFGEFELWPRERRLLRMGQDEAVGGRAFDLLLALVDGRGRVVSNAELMERVWPGIAVEPNNLQVQVWTLRQLLGRQAITTVARRGYRFTLPVAVRSGVGVRAPGPLRPGLAAAAWAAAVRQHGWVTLLLLPPHRPDPLREQAVSLAHDLGRTLWSLDARHLHAARPAPAWLHRLRQGQVLLWLENAHLVPREALAQLGTAGPGSLHVLAASPVPLGVPGEQVCAAAEPVQAAPAAAGEAPANASSLRWHPRGGPGGVQPD